MKFRTPLTVRALLAVAATSGLLGCGEVGINGRPPPNAPPRASEVEFSDPFMTAGQSLTVSGAESLFLDHDDPLTLTATSSDTTVVAVYMVLVDYAYSLTLHALSPGVAEVSITATEPMGDGSQDDQQPSGRSVTRTVSVTVVDSTAQQAPASGNHASESGDGRATANTDLRLVRLLVP